MIFAGGLCLKGKEKKKRGWGVGGAHTTAVHSLCNRLSLSRSVPVRRMMWQFPVNGVAVFCKTSPNHLEFKVNGMSINVNWDVLSLWNYICVNAEVSRCRHLDYCTLSLHTHTHSGLYKLSRSHGG